MLFSPEITVWLYQEKIDMRKQIDGLGILVSSNMNKNPSNGEIFLFFSKRSDKIKVLYWDKNGFCLWYKRLEKGSFKVPDNREKINYEQLRWLLDGLDINNLQGHKKLSYSTFF